MRYLDGIRVEFVYERKGQGKVKVTGAKKSNIPIPLL